MAHRNRQSESGNRWRVVLCGALLGLSAIGLAGQQPPPAQERPGQPSEIAEDLAVIDLRY